MNVKLEKIGIPRGDTTVRIIVRATDNTVAEYIQSYHTDVGVDKIEPEIKMNSIKKGKEGHFILIKGKNLPRLTLNSEYLCSKYKGSHIH